MKKKSFLDTLKEEATPPPKGAFTRQDVRKMGFGYTAALTKLEKGVSEGRLETGVFLIGGHRTTYYWEV